MLDVLRIKPKAAPYRRAGVAFTSADEFEVFGQTDLSPRQLAILSTDPELTLELQVGEDDWEPLPDEARQTMAERLATMTEAEWAEVETAWSAEVDAHAKTIEGELAPKKLPSKGGKSAPSKAG